MLAVNSFEKSDPLVKVDPLYLESRSLSIRFVLEGTFASRRNLKVKKRDVVEVARWRVPRDIAMSQVEMVTELEAAEELNIVAQVASPSSDLIKSGSAKAPMKA